MNELEALQNERMNSLSSWTRNKKFDKDGFIAIKDLWNYEELYYPAPRERGTFNYWGKKENQFRFVPEEKQVTGSLSRYNHPMYRKIHSGIRKKVENIIGRKLYNTYYYDRYYFPGQELTNHTDRPACEISVSIHVSTNLPDGEKDWPIWMKACDVYTDKTKKQILIPGEKQSVILNPGDGVLYKGCERPHWRDPMPTPRRRKRDILLRREQPEYYYHQIFFHYVLADGQRAHHAWDKANIL